MKSLRDAVLPGQAKEWLRQRLQAYSVEESIGIRTAGPEKYGGGYKGRGLTCGVWGSFKLMIRAWALALVRAGDVREGEGREHT